MLALEIELLTGVYRAALPDNSAAEWPPHPERAFSALVQAWGYGGCDVKERAALEWLESLTAPRIEADPMRGCDQRSTPTVFVPPNDSPRDKDRIALLPDRRSRQARNFQVAIPVHSTVRLIWHEAPGQSEHRTALEALAHRVASLGHSASLVRFAFIDATEDGSLLWHPDTDGNVALRVAHPGRLRRLEDWLSKDERPQSGMSIRYLEPEPPPPTQATKSVFGAAQDWFVFEDAGGVAPISWLLRTWRSAYALP